MTIASRRSCQCGPQSLGLRLWSGLDIYCNSLIYSDDKKIARRAWTTALRIPHTNFESFETRKTQK